MHLKMRTEWYSVTCELLTAALCQKDCCRYWDNVSCVYIIREENKPTYLGHSSALNLLCKHYCSVIQYTFVVGLGEGLNTRLLHWCRIAFISSHAERCSLRKDIYYSQNLLKISYDESTNERFSCILHSFPFSYCIRFTEFSTVYRTYQKEMTIIFY